MKHLGKNTLQILAPGLAFGESPRWRGGRLWVADWAAHELLTIDSDGHREVVLQLPFIPFTFSIDWLLPDERLLIISGGKEPLLRQEPDGSLVPHADLSSFDAKGWNEIVVY